MPTPLGNLPSMKPTFTNVTLNHKLSNFILFAAKPTIIR